MPDAEDERGLTPVTMNRTTTRNEIEGHTGSRRALHCAQAGETRRRTQAACAPVFVVFSAEVKNLRLWQPAILMINGHASEAGLWALLNSKGTTSKVIYHAYLCRRGYDVSLHESYSAVIYHPAKMAPSLTSCNTFSIVWAGLPEVPHHSGAGARSEEVSWAVMCPRALAKAAPRHEFSVLSGLNTTLSLATIEFPVEQKLALESVRDSAAFVQGHSRGSKIQCPHTLHFKSPRTSQLTQLSCAAAGEFFRLRYMFSVSHDMGSTLSTAAKAENKDAAPSLGSWQLLQIVEKRTAEYLPMCRFQLWEYFSWLESTSECRELQSDQWGWSSLERKYRGWWTAANDNDNSLY
ncbi:hypothetical protein FB451DRAFT_1164039 [Mycena latifolia]|nr:hypothetical protein FB451DRAFT_1164039 [Mycena latifolia]